MKILLVTDGIPPHQLGGAGRIVCETADALIARGHEVTILTAAKDASGSTNAKVEALPVLPLKSAHWRGVLGIKREKQIMRIIWEIQPDIVHAHATSWQFGYRFLSACAQNNIRTFFTSHDAMTVAYAKVGGDEHSLAWDNLRVGGRSYNPFRNLLIRKHLRSCAKLFCVSDALRAFLESHGLPPMLTLHNGIDAAKWKTMDRSAARKKINLPADRSIFMLAGRIGAAKGSLLATKTLPQNAMLLVAGSADVKEFSVLGERVKILGKKNMEEMKMLYAASNAVLVPSTYLDPFPTVCLEAMAMERAVIATNKGGAKEAVIDGKTGWIIDPMNVQAWKERLNWCEARVNELDAAGKTGRKHIEEHLSMKQHVDMLLHAYTSP